MKSGVILEELVKGLLEKEIPELTKRLRSHDGELVLINRLIGYQDNSHVGCFGGAVSSSEEETKIGLIRSPYLEFKDEIEFFFGGTSFYTINLMVSKQLRFIRPLVVFGHDKYDFVGIDRLMKLERGGIIIYIQEFPEVSKVDNYEMQRKAVNREIKYVKDFKMFVGDGEVRKFMLRSYKMGKRLYDRVSEILKNPNERIRQPIRTKTADFLSSKTYSR